MNEVNQEIYKPVKMNRLWMILVLGTLTAIGPLSIDMYLPSLPKLTDDLQTGASLAQLTLTACLLGLSVGQLFVGSISDIYGRRKPLIIALIIYVASSYFVLLRHLFDFSVITLSTRSFQDQPVLLYHVQWYVTCIQVLK